MQIHFTSCFFEYKEMTTVGCGTLAITLGIFRFPCWLWTTKTTFSKNGLITCRACEGLWCILCLSQKSPQRCHCAQNIFLWSRLIQGQHHKPVSSTWTSAAPAVSPQKSCTEGNILFCLWTVIWREGHQSRLEQFSPCHNANESY